MMNGITGFTAASPQSNPLSGLGSTQGNSNSLSGLVDGGNMGLGVGNDQGTSSGSGAGIMPNQSAPNGSSFGDTLKSMVIDGPSATRTHANDLMARFAAGENIDPQTLAVATAKAGVEVQMATRTISSAVSAVRTLFQMQI